MTKVDILGQVLLQLHAGIVDGDTLGLTEGNILGEIDGTTIEPILGRTLDSPDGDSNLISLPA